MGLKERLEEGIYTAPACTHTQAPIAKTFSVAGINKEAFKRKKRQTYILQNNRMCTCASVFARVCVSAPERVSVLTYTSGYYQ